MNTLAPNPTLVPGAALLTLEQIRDTDNSVRTAIAGLRAKTDLAHLKLITRLHNLPEPELAWSRYGIIGTFHHGHATDKLIEYVVREWAEAFAADVTVVDPLLVGRDRDGKAVVDPGWAVMHACVRGLRFTVGGRLIEAVSTR